MGQVLNDAGQGVARVTVTVRSNGPTQTAATQGDGSFFVPHLVPGDYEVQVDADSLPLGYSADAIRLPQQITVGTSAPGQVVFTARAFRSISGRVLSYDPKAGRYVPVIAAQVTLRELRSTATTDSMGRYLFRDLAAGPYTLSVQNGTQTSTHAVHLDAPPVDLRDVDFQINRPNAP